jgi:hypothetical protein
MRYLWLVVVVSLSIVALAGPTPGQAVMADEAAASMPPAEPLADEAAIAQALLEALRIATDSVIARLGQPGGFLNDPAIRIPLPGGLAEVRDGLVVAGLGPLVEDLEYRMNRAAEAAVPEARGAFREALAATTIEDARGILAGPDDAATRHFQTLMGTDLAARLLPIVETELQEAGAVQAFDAFVAEYAALPLMPNIRGSLTGHVVDGALAGFFHAMAEEERAIRHDPAARTTALLRSVFGGG